MKTHSILHADAERERAVLHELAEGTAPDVTKRITLVHRLNHMRDDLRELRKRYSLKTMAEMLGHPKLGIKVAPATLGRYLATKQKSRKEVATP